MICANNILVYDSSCSFCKDTANFLQKFIGKNKLKIISNKSYYVFKYSKKLDKDVIKKDVHVLMCSKKNVYGNIFSGHEAVIKVLTLNQNLSFLNDWAKYKLFNQLFRLLYIMLKKIKKYYNYYFE